MQISAYYRRLQRRKNAKIIDASNLDADIKKCSTDFLETVKDAKNIADLFIYLFIYSSAKLTKCTMNIFQYHTGHQVNGHESHSSNQ